MRDGDEAPPRPSSPRIPHPSPRQGVSMATVTPNARSTTSVGQGDPATDRAFFGHPRGLSTLFFTEMWERFSYYGMRGLLILFMTAPLAAGGLALSDTAAGAIYGMYTSMVYMTNLPGGWIADRILGQRR